MFNLWLEKWRSFGQRFRVPKNVTAMGFVSFFNDIASEMVYPLVPIFLTSVLQAPATVVGLIEGVAEATASLVKVVGGWLSDHFKKRKIFVVCGYSLSSLSKALLSLASSWPLVLSARFLDRLGKGVRTPPRDALILESIKPQERGLSFGFHRAMDTMGAVLGPILGLGLLYWLANDFRKVFLFAFIPSFLGVLILIIFVREAKYKATAAETAAVSQPRLKWSTLDAKFKIFMLISVIFALGNSSNAFLILRAQNLGLSVIMTVAAYVLFNIFYSVFSLPAGVLSDKIGARRILAWSFFLFAAVYLILGLASSAVWVWILFPLYGLYMAMTDGVTRAYISEMVPTEQSGTAFGAYDTVIGLCALLASLAAGWLWSSISPGAPFIFGGLLSLASGILYVVLLPGKGK